MKRLFLVLSLAILLPSLTGCACLYELERAKMQALGCLFNGLFHCGGYGCGGCGYVDPCGPPPCQGGYAPPQFQGGCNSCGGGGSYNPGYSHHAPVSGIPNYGVYGAPAYQGVSNGCSSCGTGAIGTPTFQAPVMVPHQ